MEFIQDFTYPVEKIKVSSDKKNPKFVKVELAQLEELCRTIMNLNDRIKILEAKQIVKLT